MKDDVVGGLESLDPFDFSDFFQLN